MVSILVLSSIFTPKGLQYNTQHGGILWQVTGKVKMAGKVKACTSLCSPFHVKTLVELNISEGRP